MIDFYSHLQFKGLMQTIETVSYLYLIVFFQHDMDENQKVLEHHKQQ